MPADLSLADRVRRGHPRALARAISLVEDGTPEGEQLIQQLYRDTQFSIATRADQMRPPPALHAFLGCLRAAKVHESGTEPVRRVSSSMVAKVPSIGRDLSDLDPSIECLP